MQEGPPEAITVEQVVPLLLKACPSFITQWESDTREANLDENWDSEPERLDYMDAGDFVRHLVALKLAGHTEEFPAVFNVIERLVTEGDDYVANLGVIGYIEGLQMGSVTGAGLEPEQDFRPYLRPTSNAYWDAINRFWRDGTLIPNIPRLS